MQIYLNIRRHWRWNGISQGTVVRTGRNIRMNGGKKTGRQVVRMCREETPAGIPEKGFLPESRRVIPPGGFWRGTQQSM